MATSAAGQALLRSNLRQVVYTLVPLSPSSIICGWEPRALADSNGSLCRRGYDYNLTCLVSGIDQLWFLCGRMTSTDFTFISNTENFRIARDTIGI